MTTVLQRRIHETEHAFDDDHRQAGVSSRCCRGGFTRPNTLMTALQPEARAALTVVFPEPGGPDTITTSPPLSIQQ